MRKVIAKIDIENIRRNGEAFARWTGKPLCAVVKANAYGHGAEEVVNALEGVAHCFAVSLLSEALTIRVAACGKDILILTPPLDEEETVLAIKNGFILTVGDYTSAKRLTGICEKRQLFARVHLKVNTGMNRYGMDERALKKTCGLFFKQSWVLVEGLYSHIYDYTFDCAEKQRLAFLKMQAIAKGYYSKICCHLSATYGALLGEKFLFDMTRIGIGLYGYLPDGAQDLDERVIETLSLQKAMSIWTQVSAVRKYTDGGVGYGRTRVEKGTPIFVARYGYADGFLRRKENGVCDGALQVNNLCMDACIRKGKASMGEWIPVMVDAGKIAEETDTIAYEVLCAASRRAEMVYDNVTFYRRERRM